MQLERSPVHAATSLARKEGWMGGGYNSSSLFAKLNTSQALNSSAACVNSSAEMLNALLPADTTFRIGAGNFELPPHRDALSTLPTSSSFALLAEVPASAFHSLTPHAAAPWWGRVGMRLYLPPASMHYLVVSTAGEMGAKEGSSGNLMGETSLSAAFILTPPVPPSPPPPPLLLRLNATSIFVQPPSLGLGVPAADGGAAVVAYVMLRDSIRGDGGAAVDPTGSSGGGGSVMTGTESSTLPVEGLQWSLESSGMAVRLQQAIASLSGPVSSAQVVAQVHQAGASDLFLLQKKASITLICSSSDSEPSCASGSGANTSDDFKASLPRCRQQMSPPPVLVPGLIRGTRYSFRLMAQTAAGWSPLGSPLIVSQKVVWSLRSPEIGTWYTDIQPCICIRHFSGLHIGSRGLHFVI
jgi:hypothetical protein